ncbi:hypothetical protein [Vibrio sp. D431a]|uniref:hypothetical protein n=1 Tax=Vibrio sp. D431a TaxID=2837388 RepID=UPI0025525F43|nr:hypothetical protein [Vibrio sp. D431a]MDK9789899.1 hypothetical protein [Vibrio sp. D431a]
MRSNGFALTQDDCKRIALLFNSRIDWIRFDSTSYQTASRLGVRELCCKHMAGKTNKIHKHTTAQCMSIAKLYSSRTEWKTEHTPSYRDAHALGIVDDCTKHMTPQAVDGWSLETCLESARRAKSPEDWDKKGREAFLIAIRHGWLSECIKHMDVSPLKWTMYTCIAASRPFINEEEWSKGCPISYKAAMYHKWLDRCPPTMPSKPKKGMTFNLEAWIKNRSISMKGDYDIATSADAT